MNEIRHTASTLTLTYHTPREEELPVLVAFRDREGCRDDLRTSQAEGYSKVTQIEQAVQKNCRYDWKIEMDPIQIKVSSRMCQLVRRRSSGPLICLTGSIMVSRPSDANKNATYTDTPHALTSPIRI